MPIDLLEPIEAVSAAAIASAFCRRRGKSAAFSLLRQH